jgi:membrane-bound lytic murein transglycosylase A
VTRPIAAVALALLLGACAGGVVPPSGAGRAPAPVVPAREVPAPVVRIVPATPLPAQPVAAVPGAATAAAAGVLPGPAVETLPITDSQAASALAAFRLSCPGLLRRSDVSGLTRGADWQPACDAARSAAPGDARNFFAQWFEAVQVGDGRAFATGYYEPEIAASRTRAPGYDTPVYARPDDLVEADLGQFQPELKGKVVRGRVQGGKLVPYHDRAAIVAGAIGAHARVLAWAADPVAFFFLQVQGSGRLRMPDGSVMRIGYDTQNGRPYVGIGALMRQRGLLAPGQASMQGIVAWLHAHPEEGRAIMDENGSFVFFRELTTPPLGAMGYPVAGRTSVAADPKFMPLGAPVFLSLDRADAVGLWVAQDTGGAIKGANRVDTFWGAGPLAEATAGGMSARGTAWLLLPRGTTERLREAQVTGGVTGGAPLAQP